MSGPLHDGGRQPPSSRFTISGGTGGTRAHLEDLQHAAAALERAADALDDAARRVGELMGLVNRAAPWSPQTTPWASNALAPLCSPRRGIAARARQARATASSLRATVDLYSRTDLDVSALVRQGLIVGGHVLGEAGPLVWLAAGGVVVASGIQVALGVLTLRMLRQTPTMTGLLLRAADSSTAQLRRSAGPLGFTARTLGGPGLLPAGLGWPTGSAVELVTPGVAAALIAGMPGRARYRGEPVSAAARLLGRFAGIATVTLGTPTRGLVVAQRITAPSGDPASAEGGTAPPRDTADVLGQIETLRPTIPPTQMQAETQTQTQAEPAGSPPGTIGIQRLDHPDGTKSWVVTIPGTQNWSPLAGPNPMDLSTNLDIVAGQRDDVSALVVEAMRAAGIAEGEPVALAGFSQGGLVAMQIALDPALQREFSVAAVVTAGSPVGALEGELPPGVQSLHLQSTQDLVPGTDGAANPDHPQRTTVTGDLAASWHAEDRAAALTPAAAHDVAAYARMARDVSALDDPSVEAFEAMLGTVIGGPGTTASTTYYQGIRVP